MNTISSIKQTLFTNWNFVRWLRLGLGLFIAFRAVQLHDSFSGMIAIFLLFQAVTNTGCCGSGGCAIPASSQKDIEGQEGKFEEIKSKSTGQNETLDIH